MKCTGVNILGLGEFCWHLSDYISYLKEISVFIHVFVLFRFDRINGNQILNYKIFCLQSKQVFFPISLKNTTKMIIFLKNAEIGLCLIK